MKLQRWCNIVNGITHNQKGFTFIELLIVIAITVLITSAATMAIFQVFNVNTKNSNHMAAIRQVQNAGFWMSQDSQQAQSIITDDDAGTTETEILTLSWKGWAYKTTGNQSYVDIHEVRYTFDANELQRKATINTYEVEDLVTPISTQSSTTFIASFITAMSISTSQPPDNKIEATITATVADATEQRTYEISPRPETV